MIVGIDTAFERIYIIVFAIDTTIGAALPASQPAVRPTVSTWSSALLSLDYITTYTLILHLATS